MTTPSKTAGTRHYVRRTGPAVGAQKGTTNKTKVGGGFNPSVSVGFTKNVTNGGSNGVSAAQTPSAGGQAAGRGAPGGDFMSNEDIRAFCEYHRKKARQDAVELAMAAEHLESVLRHIPDQNGTMAGALMRARRVSRHLKRAAKARQIEAKAFAQVYAQFEREYEANLRKVGKGRTQQPRRGFAFA